MLLNLKQRNKVASVAPPSEPLSWMAQFKDAVGWKKQTATIQEELDWKIIRKGFANKTETKVPSDPRMLVLLESFKQVQSHMQRRAQSLASMMYQLDDITHDLQDSYEQLLLGAIDVIVEIENDMQRFMEKVQLTVAFQTRERKQQEGDIPAPRSITSSQNGTCPRGLHPQDTSLVSGLGENRHHGRVCCTRGAPGHVDSSRREPKPPSSRQSESTDSMLCTKQVHVRDRQQVDLLCQHRCCGHDYSLPCFVNICCSEAASIVDTNPSAWGMQP